jgi:hypothetical protein
MPPRKPTLSFGVTSLWPFSISDEDWKKLETHYGYAIPPDLRSAVVAKTQTMRWRSEAWQSALPTREAKKRIARIKRAADEWLGSTDRLPDKVDEVRALIMSVDDYEQVERVINPFMNFVVASCDRALLELEFDLASKEAQDASHPWEDWIAELIGLFDDQYRLPTSASKDVDKAKPGRRPSKFVIFIRELQRLIEPQYRQHTHSDEALAAAITRARSLREGDQTCQDEPRESEQAPIGTRTEDPPSE